MEDLSHHQSKRNQSRITSSRHGWLAPAAAACGLFVMTTGLISFHPVTTLPTEKLVEDIPDSPQYTRDQIVGTWTFYDGITRRSENRPDGTSTLNITFSVITSFIYGSKLKMETDWDLKGDVLTYTVTGGEPEAGLKRVTKDFGSVASYRILRLTEEEMLLLDLDGSDDLYLWKRES